MEPMANKKPTLRTALWSKCRKNSAEGQKDLCTQSFGERLRSIGAFIIRIGLWGPLYYNYEKEPPP